MFRYFRVFRSSLFLPAYSFIKKQVQDEFGGQTHVVDLVGAKEAVIQVEGPIRL